MKPGSSQELAETRRILLVCFLLSLATGVVYWQVHAFDFINLDDPFIIYKNPYVTKGLTLEGMVWGLTTSYFEYWHPLTWWSHMLDCELFGLNAGWHHLTSLAFHMANTVILFLALRQTTGMLARSAVVAALFALHPMHVESVVWLAERKDLLSTFFWLLSVWAYASYFRELRSNGPKIELFYRLSLLFFFGGIMSKPMVVTLPFVLLLLDYWPLKRFQTALPDMASSGQKSKTGERNVLMATFLGLVKEKIPFFGITLLSCLITFSNVKAAHNILSAEKVPWSFRLANVAVSYARYLGKFIWPANMSAFYPMPAHWTGGQVGGSVLILLLISGVVIVRFRSAPYLVFGWCMFLGTLVPTLSLVPVGLQSIADRYTYLSYIGLFVAVVWAVAEIPGRGQFRLATLAGLTVVALLACSMVTRIQAGYWRNNFTLWPHCLAVTEDNFPANYNLGYALQNAGQTTEAAGYYRTALRIKPTDVDANLNLGRTLAAVGRMNEATNYFAKAVQIQPDSADAHGNLGAALFESDDFSGANAELTESLRLDPRDFRSMVGLARTLGAQGKSDDAIRCYSDALGINPNSAEVNYYLGLEQMKRGLFDDAVSSLSAAARLDPTLVDARIQLEAALSKRAH